MLHSILISLVINLFLIMSLFAQNEKISHSLQNALRLTPENETQKVWIYFTDKGGSIDSKLRSVESNLSVKSKIRRSKSMGENIVDRFDLPINSNYLNEIDLYTEKIVVKSKWLNAISAEVKPQNVDLIASKNFIKKLDVVRKFKRIEPEDSVQPIESTGIENVYTLDYGSSYTQNAQIHVPKVHDLGITGSGVLICLLDNSYLLNHETFDTMDILSTWDFIHGDSIVNDPSSEGTHGGRVLSAIAGYTPGRLIGTAFGASYMLGKTEVKGSETPIEEDYWVAGAEWADSLGTDIISSSLGYHDWYTWEDMDGNTAVTTIAADIAAGRGILVLTSVGNYGDGPHNTFGAPADGDSVIAVGAVNSSGTRRSSSSVGPTTDGRIKPDVAAMGGDVVTCAKTDPHEYRTSSGTSFACPLAAGVAALVLSANPSLTAMQVRDALRETASQATNPDKYLGWGIVNAFDAVFYYNAKITHTQINDTVDLNGPYKIIVEIESILPLIAGEIKLIYGTDTNFGNEIIMQSTGNPNEYSAQINGTGSSEEYFYYIYAKNEQQISTYLPFSAPDKYFRFYTGEVSVFDPDQEINTPQQFTLLQNYPNPFNPQTTIKYAMPNSGNVELIIYNLIGQQLFQINRGYQKAGWHKLVFNELGLSSGIYFYKINIKDVSGNIFSKTRKMVYIK